MEKNPLEGREREIRDILDHFGPDKEVHPKVLNDYCVRMKFTPISTGELEDFRFQDAHDGRVAKALPQIFEELARWQYIPEFVPKAQKDKMRAENDDIEWKVAKVLEDNGIVYKEVDIVTRNISQMLSTITENAGRRINNMIAVVLSDLAKQRFGQDLKVADLAAYYRERAAELGIELHATQKGGTTEA